MGHVNFHGLAITIETPKGAERHGRTLPLHYGYIKRTEGADGEHFDCFLGPHLDSTQVFVVDQVDADGNYDESKALLGFRNEQEARAGYLSAYSKGWKCGPIKALTMPAFKRWLEQGHTGKPIGGQAIKLSGGLFDEQHPHKPKGEGGGQFAKKGEAAAGPAPPAPPKHGERATSLAAKTAELNAKKEALKQAIAEHKAAMAEHHEGRHAAFGEVKEQADAAAEKAGEHEEAITAAMGQVAWNSDDDNEQRFNDLDSAWGDYDASAPPRERFEQLQKVEAEAKGCLTVKQKVASAATPGGIAKAKALRKEAADDQKAKDAIQDEYDAVEKAGDQASTDSWAKAHNEQFSALRQAIREANEEADLLENPDDGITPAQLAENKQHLQTIIANARAAREQLRVYVKHRKEMRAIKGNEGISLSSVAQDEWDDDGLPISDYAPELEGGLSPEEQHLTEEDCLDLTQEELDDASDLADGLSPEEQAQLDSMTASDWDEVRGLLNGEEPAEARPKPSRELTGDELRAMTDDELRALLAEASDEPVAPPAPDSDLAEDEPGSNPVALSQSTVSQAVRDQVLVDLQSEVARLFPLSDFGK
jgi:hypothetical protein